MAGNQLELLLLGWPIPLNTAAQKMKLSIKGFHSKSERIWWNLLKKSLLENFIFWCSVLELAYVCYTSVIYFCLKLTPES